MQCPNCGNENREGAKFCVVCGQVFMRDAGGYQSNPNPQAGSSQGYGAAAAVNVSFPPPNRSFSPDATLAKKYKALRFVATCFKVLAFVYATIFTLGGVIFFFVVLANSRRSEEHLLGLGFAVGGIIIGAAMFLGYFAVGQLFYVLMDIEENTRATRLLLSKSSAQSQ